MAAGPRIAIDAMGGDSGPSAMLAGAARARRRDASLQFLFFGDEKLIHAELQKHRNLSSWVTVAHTAESIAPNEKPSQAIRRARTTSMGMAINAVKEGKADAALAASIFHFREYSIAEPKLYLDRRGVPVRIPVPADPE